jgi:hypothetical protein
VSTETFKALLNASFSEYLAAAFQHEGDCAFVVETEDGQAIRLPTGRLVRRFMSVRAMLQASPILKRALAQLLARTLNDVCDDMSHLVLVTDSPASYYVAQLLLADTRHPPDVRMPHQVGLVKDAKGSHDGSLPKVVLLVDAVYRGETVVRQIHKLRDAGLSVHRVIVVARLSAQDSPIAAVSEVDTTALLDVPFDPQFVEDDPENRLEIIEIDRITHMPLRSPCEFRQLSDDPERAAFLEQHADVFMGGYHVTGQRVHTLSLPTYNLVKSYQQQLSKWLASAVADLIQSLPGDTASHDVVLLSRHDAAVFKLLDEVAALVSLESRERKLPLGSTFCGTCVSVPGERRQIYTLEEKGLLTDIWRADRELLEAKSPENDFIAVYLDDAAVSGNSLRDFLGKGCRLSVPMPSALLAIATVNRLSPGENRFFSLCQQLRSDQGTANGKSVEFRFASLFRLQVGSTEMGADTAVHRLIRKMRSEEEALPRPLRAYYDAIQQKAERILTLRGSKTGRPAVIQHPFYPGEDANPQMPITCRSARIRHLLALAQQNEPVLSELLSEIQAAVESEDKSLLAILALDPRLLDQAPLVGECWSDIKRLCHSAITDASVDACCKSDALAILATHPDQLLHGLDAILVPSLTDQTLAAQLFTYLFTLVRRDEEWLEAVCMCLDRCRQRLGEDAFGWASRLIHTAQRLRDITHCDDMATAVMRLYAFVARVRRHDPKVYEIWRDCFKGFVSNPTSISGDKVDALFAAVAPCLAHVHTCLIPALDALRYVAGVANNNESAVLLEEAMWTAESASSKIQQILDGVRGGNAEAFGSLAEEWARLCDVTMRTQTPEEFLVQEDAIPDAPVLARVMPQFVSMPLGILKECLRTFPECTSIPAEPPWVVSLASRESVRGIFRLLLDNVAQHGERESIEVACQQDGKGPQQECSITITNTVKQERRPGAGRGILEAKAIAAIEGFFVGADEEGGTFRAQIRFPRSFVVTPATM